MNLSIFSSLPSKVLSSARKAAGFTMIELLIVISILGILAVAVLSAIDPIEQINRGRDTGLRSDAEQLLSAIDRYNAFQGYFPWVSSTADTALTQAWNQVDDANWEDNQGIGCMVLDKLSAGMTPANPACAGANELKQSFVDRVSDAGYRGLFIYNGGNTGDSTYVCFLPQSGAFETEATNRCNDLTANPLPDFPMADACTSPNYYVCLP